MGASPTIRQEIEARLAAENLSTYSVAKVTTTVRKPVKDRAQPQKEMPTMSNIVAPKNEAIAPIAESGWQGRLVATARKAGVPESTISALVRQVKIETGGRLTVFESMSSYSNSWLRSKMRIFWNWTDEKLQALRKSGEEAFFNTMYGARGDLGNRGVESGDGFRYRGRGPLQLTGRYNYGLVGKLLGVDLLADPDWVVRTEDNAVASVIAFLKVKGKLTVAMSANDMARLVNPGLA